MLTKMTAFLARAPALQGLSLTVGDVGPAPYTAGLWCRGITVLDRRENLPGRGPVLGNARREVLRAEQGRMERADAGGTAVYTVRLQAEYTQVYTEETT